jgi:CO/xanthine dehydrogenase Mo-binding subunit
MQGCISIGFGLAMTEEMVWDKGNLTNGSFADYRIPVASDLPAINSSTVETIDQQGPFGAKSASEISICAVPAAINNAIFDAVGVRIRSLPITPEKLLKALSSTET